MANQTVETYGWPNLMAPAAVIMKRDRAVSIIGNAAKLT
jgi:hypothetical protein